jgi:hypothetical protein
MKKIITDAGKFGPYETVDVLEDRYRVNGAADLPFTVIGQGEISDVVDGDFPPPSTTPSDVQTAEQAEFIRQIRNNKLKESDWRFIKALESNIPQDFAWAAYRQNLRDITTQSGFPWSIDWPTQP